MDWPSSLTTQDVYKRQALVVPEGARTDEDVQILAADDLGRSALHLLGRQMRQQVGHAEHRVALVLADADGHRRTVPADDHAVQRKRQGRPLVFFDPAVIVGVEIREIMILIQRVRLEIQPRGIDMRRRNRDAVGNRPAACLLYTSTCGGSMASIFPAMTIPRYKSTSSCLLSLIHI